MKAVPVTCVRIYITEEQEHHLHLLKRLHDEEGVRGVTVLRGISGFGASGRIHQASLIDLGINLPLVIEFFDTPAKVEAIMEHLETIIEPGHLVTWPAQVHE